MWFGTSPHNLYLRIWFENGFLGLVGYLAFIAMSLGQLYQYFKRTGSSLALVAYASILGILLNSMFIDTLHWRHFWALLTLAWLVPKADVPLQDRTMEGPSYSGPRKLDTKKAIDKLQSNHEKETLTRP